MKELKPFLISLAIIVSFFFAIQAEAAPLKNTLWNVEPFTDSVYYLGTTTPSVKAWLQVVSDSYYDTDASDGCAQWASNVLTSTGSACGAGGGGSGGGTWATTTSQVTGQFINYPLNDDDIVTVGANASTTAEFYFDPNIQLAKLGNQFFALASSTLQNFTFLNATGTQATTTDFFSTTGTFTNFIFDSNLFDSFTDDITLDNNGGDLQVVDVTCTNCLTTTEVASADLATLATNVADTDFGDVTVAGGAWAVEDDSHAHTGATLSGIDISDDTNLTAGDNLTLTGDDLDLDTTLTSMTAATFSGLVTAGNFLALGSTTLQNFTAVNATTTQATTTSFAISGIASGNCLQTSTGGAIISAGAACGSGGGVSPFTHPSATTFATTTTSMSLPNSGFIGFMGNATVDTSNYSLFGNTTLTLLNARSGASIGFRIANTDVANFTTTGGFGFGSTYYNLDPGQNNMIVEGKLGIGTTTPQWPLQLASSANPQLTLSDGSLTSNHWSARNAGGNLYFATSSPTTFATTSSNSITFSPAVSGSSGLLIGTSTLGSTGLAVVGTVFMHSLTQATGGSNSDLCISATPNQLIEETTGVCVVSSRKFKHDIKTLDLSATDVLMSLRPVSFSPNDNASFDFENIQYGFIAEEVAESDPHLAKYGIDGEPRTLDDWAILSVTVKALQELNVRVEKLEKENEELRARLR